MLQRNLVIWVLVIIFSASLSPNPVRGSTIEIGTALFYSTTSTRYNNGTNEENFENNGSFWFNITEISPDGKRIKIEGTDLVSGWTQVIDDLYQLNSFSLTRSPFFFVIDDWEFWTDEIATYGVKNETFPVDGHDDGSWEIQTIFHFRENKTNYEIFFQKNESKTFPSMDENGIQTVIYNNSTTNQLLIFEKEFGILILRSNVIDRYEGDAIGPTYYLQSTSQLSRINDSDSLNIDQTMHPRENDDKFNFPSRSNLFAYFGLIFLLSIFLLIYIRYRRRLKKRNNLGNPSELYPLR